MASESISKFDHFLLVQTWKEMQVKSMELEKSGFTSQLYCIPAVTLSKSLQLNEAACKCFAQGLAHSRLLIATIIILVIKWQCWRFKRGTHFGEMGNTSGEYFLPLKIKEKLLSF